MTKYYITVIADYGPLHDLAFAEVNQSLISKLVENKIDHSIKNVAVSPFNTIETGFVLAQLALNSNLKNHLFYVNTAPRTDDKSARVNNDGEGLVYVELVNGVKIIAVNSGYSLSFIKPYIKEIRDCDVSRAGSQFRSRDIFPAALITTIKGKAKKTKVLNAEDIPSVPENIVCYIDGYGNVKTNISPEIIDNNKGENLIIYPDGKSVFGISRVVRVKIGTGIFSVADGEYVCAKGSSGWHDTKFIEIVRRGGNASKSIFGDLKVGDKIEWKI